MIYNSESQLKSEVEYDFYDVGSEEWNRILATFFGFDSYGNVIGSVTYDSTSTYLFDEVDLINQKKFEHDNNIYSDEVLLPGQNNSLLNENIVNRSAVQPIIKFENYSGGGSFPKILNDRTEYFYSDISTGTAEVDIDIPIITLSPNPTQNSFKIDLKGSQRHLDLHILNLQGQVVANFGIKPHEEIDVSNLPNGIYFCKVIVDGKVTSQKFVKM